MINKNKFLRQLHIYISLFFLPLALLYAITGIAYILGFDEDTALKETIYKSPIILEKGKEQEQIINELKRLKIAIPENTHLKAAKKEGDFSMGGVHYSLIFKQDENATIITAKTRSLLADMIMLHKDKGKWYFSILSVGFGIALFILYISGLMMSFTKNKKEKQKQIFILFAAFLTSFFLAYISL